MLRRMRAGDDEAFRSFYLRHQRPIYRFALHMTGRPEAAEEAVQEAFMTLIREAAKFDPARGTPQAFLFGIARNHVRRVVESNSRFVPLADDGDLQVRAGQASLSYGLGESLSDDLARAEIIELVRRAILALPEHYREAVSLCDLEGLDYAAAASALNCPIGTVRSRLARGREMLVVKLRPAAMKKPSRAAGGR
ncbi:MAG TPA: sigma-70 family RNA polymerase sigma factor [Candidatus Acidoferrales bacterium]|nr:sigma-70 family RNA polymerase sigma factor [Candidatus Acidoferrales bacterium]